MKKSEKFSWIILDVLLGLALIICLMSLPSCAKTIYVPVQGEYRIEYRDSLIYLKDTVTVEIPKEKIVEVLPQIDTSYLETKLAHSTAFLDLDSKTIHHTLENKPNSLKTAIDTVVVVQTKTEYKDKVVIEEVEVPVIPNWMWGVCIYAALTVGILLMKIIGKFR